MKTSAIRIATPFVTLVVAILAGGVLGALTNFINGRVSALYFQNIMRWNDVSDIARAAVAEGIFEGLICGLVFGTIFVVAFSIISRLRFGIAEALSYLGFWIGSAFLAWCLGGVLGILLAWVSPDSYRHAFIGVPQDFSSMLRYAWVGGSIWGVQFGGFALLVLWIVVFALRWKANKSVQATATGAVADL
jgi:hypothetical protein